MGIDAKVLDELLADNRKPEDLIGDNGLLKHRLNGSVDFQKVLFDGVHRR